MDKITTVPDLPQALQLQHGSNFDKKHVPTTAQLMAMSPLRGMGSQLGKMTLRPERGDGDSIEVRPTSYQNHHLVGGSSDMKEVLGAQYQIKPLFEKSVTQKKNIYSTEPIPLNNPWTFWVDRTTRGLNMEQYEKSLRKIYTVFTVQRFWVVYYNIPKPSDLQPRSSLHMMRDNKKPVWEEEYNCKGGSYRIRVQKKDTNKVWRELLMAAIGEQLNEYCNPNDAICGISVSLKDKEDVLSIWNANAEKAQDARIFECVQLLNPDIVFLSTFYKPHITHHAFDKTKKGVFSNKDNAKFEVKKPVVE